MEPQDRYVASLKSYAAGPRVSCRSGGEHFKCLVQFFDDQIRSSRSHRYQSPSTIAMAIFSDSQEGRQWLALPRAADEVISIPPVCQGTAHLVFIHGFASATALAAIGAHYRVDPEFFRRCVGFIKGPSFYDYPPLPTASRTVGRLRISTLCARKVPLTMKEVESLRKEESARVARHHQQLTSNVTIGSSIVRAFATLNEVLVAVEQDVLFCVRKRKQGGWSAIIWQDMGQPLDRLVNAPWHTKGSTEIEPKPVIQHGWNKARKASGNNTASGADEPGGDSCNFGMTYGSTLASSIVRSDATYALSELYALAAASENQFLNATLNLAEEAARSSSRHEEQARRDLQYFKLLLDSHTMHLEESLAFINLCGSPAWPGATDPSEQETVKAQMHDMAVNFGYLVSRSKDLSAKCSQGIRDMVNGSRLSELQTSRRQGEAVYRLSLLALFFLPLSLTTGIFGMNIYELNSGSGKIQNVFIVTVVSMGLTCLMCFPREVVRAGSYFFRRPRRGLPNE
ncbi:hypothetical protein CONLIGDRAFT_700600 [Coniochaeta ligniaria NRRL 30616]|uniref:Cora-domain-containing protein n=1 Tax=Coniochaeta ligniaria NRRL 30616 TaxID=1408157 RepID=A0A1J7JT58_9PEZI|nr:hypothetical protein CONLIGDRAFT_700600 [Coniochaeta ligniaria NRRL 30616]